MDSISRPDTLEFIVRLKGMLPEAVVQGYIKTNPVVDKKKIADLNRGDVQKLYNTKAAYSVSVAKMVKTVMNISLSYAVTIKLIPVNLAEGVNLPKNVPKKPYHTRPINTQKTLTQEHQEEFRESLLDIVIDANQYLPWTSNKLQNISSFWVCTFYLLCDILEEAFCTIDSM